MFSSFLTAIAEQLFLILVVNFFCDKFADEKYNVFVSP